MNDLEFYANGVIRNNVAGVRLEAGPTEWEAALGNDFIDVVEKSDMRRDYGLMEIFFTRTEAWECTGLTFQLHRLAWGTDGMIPHTLSERYGEFSQHVPFEKIRSLLSRGGYEIDEDSSETHGEYIRYRVPGTFASILVIAEPITSEPHERGSVWSISLNPRPPEQA
ncbi:hypothetical protein [Streptomyces sp. NPDC050428]|uniref:hypothetical protein n=1 Tax=Streptomyces sp. NPDC050428 TaxID=3155757 RepID=UPI003412288E